MCPSGIQNGLDPDTTGGVIDLAYALPNVHVEYLQVEPPAISTTFWRSVGRSRNVFVTESFVDELAASARQDAVAIGGLCSTEPRARKQCAIWPRKSSVSSS
jgi:isoquinoline 1-oxidoreductase subunit beta